MSFCISTTRWCNNNFTRIHRRIETSEISLLDPLYFCVELRRRRWMSGIFNTETGKQFSEADSGRSECERACVGIPVNTMWSHWWQILYHRGVHILSVIGNGIKKSVFIFCFVLRSATPVIDDCDEEQLFSGSKLWTLNSNHMVRHPRCVFIDYNQ